MAGVVLPVARSARGFLGRMRWKVRAPWELPSREEHPWGRLSPPVWEQRWRRPVTWFAEVDQAADQLGAAEVDLAAGELGAGEVDLAAGELGAEEVDLAAGDLRARRSLTRCLDL